MSENRKSGDGGPVPQAVVSRLSLYLRELQQLVRGGCETTSSTQLGLVLGFTDAQVRKDLAYFGQFGYPGLGYRCQELISEIKRILGTNHQWPVGIVGIGNLGQALLGYRGFGEQGFRVAAAFDSDPTKVGQCIEGTPVHHIDDLATVCEAEDIKLGLIAVPAAAAEEVAQQLVKAGMEGILNFAPITLNLNEQVGIVSVDLAIELEQLTFAVVNRRKNA